MMNWFKITWKRLKSKTPPYFLTWAFVMVLYGGFITLLEEARTEQFLPAFFERNYKTIKFIYRGLTVLIPLLATQNYMLSKATLDNYEHLKPGIQEVEKEIHSRPESVENNSSE